MPPSCPAWLFDVACSGIRFAMKAALDCEKELLERRRKKLVAQSGVSGAARQYWTGSNLQNKEKNLRKMRKSWKHREKTTPWKCKNEMTRERNITREKRGRLTDQSRLSSSAIFLRSLFSCRWILQTEFRRLDEYAQSTVKKTMGVRS